MRSVVHDDGSKVSTDYRALLLDMFRAAVSSATPDACLSRHLPEPPTGRTIVVGAGKAAASMAAAVEASWSGPIEGVVVTRYGHGCRCRHIEVVQAAHPVPDEAGVRAARSILERVSGLTSDDLVLVLISGGGSALLSLPAGAISLAEKQSVNRALLNCGARISEINTVRKHLSDIKGGRLAAAAAPAKVVTLAISDVPGDDPSTIASGPTVPDDTTSEDALAILVKYGIAAPDSIVRHLKSKASETPKPTDPRLKEVSFRLVATPQKAMEAAARVARDAGIASIILGSSIEGEARDVGLVHAGIARQCGEWGQPLEIPCVLISGGETTVTVAGKGRGGRNAEFLLSLGIAAEGKNGVWAIAADTDGIDGTEDNAGAIVTPETLARAAAAGIDVKASLAANDAYGVFARLDDLIITGPTLTNVNDFRAVLITRRS
ncbi:glycerate kinase [Bradyrhizobium sp. B124]|uniref:glycerate kinase type-2 family protein n=1 Tax=Bradyrhizobium sp. B124 TaxID=3140245 RepID=UPI003183EA35